MGLGHFGDRIIARLLQYLKDLLARKSQPLHHCPSASRGHCLKFDLVRKGQNRSLIEVNWTELIACGKCAGVGQVPAILVPYDRISPTITIF